MESSGRMTRRLILYALFACLLGAGVWALDHRLKRPWRVRRLREIDRLLTLRDDVLEFHLDHGRPPGDLKEIVPTYASAAAILYTDPASGQMRPAQLDTEQGTLGWPEPLRYRGVWPEQALLSVHMPQLSVVRDSISGEPVFLVAQDVVRLSGESVVLEAEHVQFLTYGWQIEEAESASQRAYIHLPEGAGDEMHSGGPIFDPAVRSGDFYNVTRDNRPMEARYTFRIPRAGRYQVWVRTMAHRSNCSNVIRARVNEGPLFAVGHNGSEPFVWLWHHPHDAELRAGANSIGFFAYQDGVKVDQVVLTPAALPGPPGMGTLYAGHAGPDMIGDLPPLTMTLSTPSLNITGGAPASAAVYVRKNRSTAAACVLTVEWDRPRGRRRECTFDLSIAPGQVLSRIPLTLDTQSPLERREYRLRCRLLNGGKIQQERTLVFQCGYDWWILGPLPYIPAGAAGHPEPDPGKPVDIDGTRYAWKPYRHANTDHYGIMDFGRTYSGRVYDAMPQCTVYAYTQITAPASATYRMKTQGDDDLVVWINGERRIVSVHDKYTAIRSAAEHLVPLREGRNHVMFRLNQKDGQWQAAIRFSTKDDRVADITGIPFEAMGIELPDNR